MPFSLFAARCMYVAQQPLQYRRDVIRRLLNTRLVAHTALFTAVGMPSLLESYKMPPVKATPHLQEAIFSAYNHI